MKKELGDLLGHTRTLLICVIIWPFVPSFICNLVFSVTLYSMPFTDGNALLRYFQRNWSNWQWFIIVKKQWNCSAHILPFCFAWRATCRADSKLLKSIQSMILFTRPNHSFVCVCSWIFNLLCTTKQTARHRCSSNSWLLVANSACTHHFCHGLRLLILCASQISRGTFICVLKKEISSILSVICVCLLENKRVGFFCVEKIRCQMSFEPRYASRHSHTSPDGPPPPPKSFFEHFRYLRLISLRLPVFLVSFWLDSYFLANPTLRQQMRARKYLSLK